MKRGSMVVLVLAFLLSACGSHTNTTARDVGTGALAVEHGIFGR